MVWSSRAVGRFCRGSPDGEPHGHKYDFDQEQPTEHKANGESYGIGSRHPLQRSEAVTCITSGDWQCRRPLAVLWT